ncbi:leucine-rich repeat domain-containing protein [Chengkuizengella axinellae]|uniref:Leucine-rich repeat domain-containing protein n=1 Tax=Chengkuizengella axinellae TaxID=3064388 RepID=A0ABT9J1K1_9BACL|nr:leucine-rich repeat domain-containing protein [Chengkuizengella sp. 2205SS18-9]MDP5275297.1 leucine-rich repeat domain-containing protein [Chengkuizengella sp. 2205SS18-9]
MKNLLFKMISLFLVIVLFIQPVIQQQMYVSAAPQSTNVNLKTLLANGDEGVINEDLTTPSNSGEHLEIDTGQNDQLDNGGENEKGSTLSNNVNLSNLDPIIKDSNLEQAIKVKLDITGDLKVTDLEKLTELDATGLGINSLEGIENAVNLTNLYLGYDFITDEKNNITEIKSLNSLTNLTTLNLSWNVITNISNLNSLTNLTTLDLFWNFITDVESLESLKNLTSLDLSWNKITDIISLGNLTNLETLNLECNLIEEIPNLENLTNLRNLYLGSNSFTTTGITNLGNLTNLEILYIWGPDINSNGTIVKGYTDFIAEELNGKLNM